MNRLPLTLIFVALMALFAEAQNGVIIGRVRRADGQPAVGVRVAVVSTSANAQVPGDILNGIGTTDTNGIYRLENVPPGQYRIIAGSIKYPTYHPGTVDDRRATVITVALGSAESGLDITLATTPAEPSAGLEGLLELPEDLGELLGYLRELAKFPTQVVGGRILIESGGVPPGFFGNLQLVFTANTGNSSSLIISDRPQPAATKVLGSVGADGSIRATLFTNDEYRISLTRLDGKPLEGYVVKSIILGSTDLMKEKLKVPGPVSGEIVITLAPAP